MHENHINKAKPEAVLAKGSDHSASEIKSRPNVSRIMRKNRRADSFSLVEVLVVLAVISILAGLLTVGYEGISRSNQISNALVDLSSLMEYAKTEAQSRNTYVRVGFINLVNGGTAQLIAGAVASEDGTTNMVSSNIYPISRQLIFNNMQFVDSSAFVNKDLQLPSITPAPVSLISFPSDVSFSMTSGGHVTTFSKSVTITPQGEMMINNPAPTDAYVPTMTLGIQEMRGSAIPPKAQAGVLLIYGDSGQTRVFR